MPEPDPDPTENLDPLCLSYHSSYGPEPQSETTDVLDPLFSEGVRVEREEGPGSREQACTGDPGSDSALDGSESRLTDDGSVYSAPTRYGY